MPAAAILLCASFAGCAAKSATADAGADAATLYTIASSDYPTGKNPAALAIADFDGDGAADVAVANSADSTVGVFLNTAGKLGARMDFATGADPGSVTAGDVDGDGKPDLVVANNGAATVSVLMNQGTTKGSAQFAAKTDYSIGAANQVRLARAVALSDLDGDGRLDLAVVVRGANGNVLSVLLGKPGGTFAAPVEYATGTNPGCVAAGDLDGDGKPELLAGDYMSATLGVFHNLGGGTFAKRVDYPMANPIALALGDLNADGKMDVAVAGFIETVDVVLNSGTGTLLPAKTYPMLHGSSPISIAIGDLDGNGTADLVVADLDGKRISLLFNQGAGVFGGANNYAGASPYAVALGDLDGDKKPDLVVANYDDDTVSVILNQGALTPK